MSDFEIYPSSVKQIPTSNSQVWDLQEWRHNVVRVNNGDEVVINNPSPWNLVITFRKNADNIGMREKESVTIPPSTTSRNSELRLQTKLGLSLWQTVEAELEFIIPRSPNRPILGEGGESSARPVIIISRSGSEGFISLLLTFIGAMLTALLVRLLGKSQR